MRRVVSSVFVMALACDSASTPPATAPVTTATAVAPTSSGAPMASASTPTATTAVPSTNPPVETSVASPASASNEFTLRMFGAIRKTPGNLVFSGLSLRSALAMTALGAKETTLSEMAKSLSVPSVPAAIAAQAQADDRDMREARGAGAELLAANRLYGEKSYPFRADFLQLADQGFGAKLENLDFKKATEASRKTINSWVSEQTKTKIPELIPGGGLDRSTRLVLTNAVYFKAGWLIAFKPALTKDEAFFETPAKSALVPTMHRQGGMRIAQMPGVKVLELPYTGTNIVMDILLPETRDGLGKLEADLTSDMLGKLLAGFETHEVALALPKFTFSWGGDVVPSLQSLGMHAAFEKKQANFFGMSDVRGDDELYIQKVFHKAFIKLDEEGTEAAAATAVVMATTSLALPQAPVPFVADHPFLFVIRDFTKGRILFFGRVANPKS